MVDDLQRPLRVWLPAIRAGSGADVFTERLASALNKRGVEATISWFPHWSEVAPEVLSRCAPPTGVDVIHCNSTYAFAFKRKNIPLVVTEHHYILDPAFRRYKSFAQHAYHSLLMKSYLRRSYAVATAITTDSLFTAGVLRRVAGIEVTKTIPLWVDYEQFAPREYPEDDAGQRPFRLLFVGNASRRKGGDVIPLLAARLGALFQIRTTSGLRNGTGIENMRNVTALGRLTTKDLIEEYQACDAVLVPSRYEGFGYSALEAMACGKPVVGFRCGAVDEVVLDKKTGLLSEIDDLKGLEENCRYLEKDRLRCRTLGVAARIRALSNFREANAINSYMELFRRLQSS